MEAIAENIKIIKRLDWYFIIIGLFEIFFLVFLTSSFYGMILGLITLVPAYIALTEKNINWNYFVGIWAIVRNNPIIWIAMVAFMAGDFYHVGARKGFVETSMDWRAVFAIALVIVFLLSMLTSFILGIILLIKTAKHNKLKKMET